MALKQVKEQGRGSGIMSRKDNAMSRREVLLAIARGVALAALGGLAFAVSAGKRDGREPCRQPGPCARCPARRRCSLPRKNADN